MYSEQHRQNFAREGFCVIDNAIDDSEITQLKQAALAIIKAQDIATLSEVFSTSAQRRNSNQYFLDSAERVSCFLEEKAADDRQRLAATPALCVNKIGHALHELDPVFSAFSRQARFGRLAAALGIGKAQIRQSMYIFKQPQIGGEVTWHQDASFFFSQPQSVIAFWFALDKATTENGCLWVQPGGHLGPLREQFCLVEDDAGNKSTTMKALDREPWPEPDQARPVEVEAGSLVMLHGCLPHYSAPNLSDKARHAFTLHVTDGHSDYACDNWLQSVRFHPRGFEGG